MKSPLASLLLLTGLLLLTVGLAGCADLVTSVNRDRVRAVQLAKAEKQKEEAEREKKRRARAAQQTPAESPDQESPQEQSPQNDKQSPDETSSDATVPDEPSQDVKRVEAKAGVGVRGKRLENDKLNQTIVRPVKTFFRFEQRMEFDKVKHALDLYRAEHGKLPGTHEEFMEKIIKFNRINLPELPPDQRYVWADEELMVEMPAE